MNVMGSHANWALIRAFFQGACRIDEAHDLTMT